MKLTRTRQGGTLEEFYAEGLDPSYEYYSEEYAVISRMMLDLVHYLEDHHIGFDTSVGTSLHHLTFWPLKPYTIGGVRATAWNNLYTITYYLVKQPNLWPGMEHGEWETSSTFEAGQMIQAAFGCAFHTFDPAEERRAMIEWATTEHPPQMDTPPRFTLLRPERVALQRIPAQRPEPVQAFYKRLQEGGHPRYSDEGTGMFALIDYLETHQVQLPAWVYIENHNLVFTNVPDQRPGIIIKPVFDRYTVKYFLALDDAPWPRAYVTGHTHSIEEAVRMIEGGVEYLYGTTHHQPESVE